MEHTPAVSCICPTYGRTELLEEAMHCFLLQDYPGRIKAVRQAQAGVVAARARP